MRIVCAPDSFKGSISAVAASGAMARGLQDADPQIEIDVCPVGDGGEGTLDAIGAAQHVTVISETVIGPDGAAIDASWGLLAPGVAFVELASASGLTLVPVDARNPMTATTLGTGQLINHAVGRGVEKVILGVGGSATLDAGMGILHALGGRLLDASGGLLMPPIDVTRIANIESPTTGLPRIVVACDVTNPLLGPEGAGAVYGPQKGASPAAVAAVERWYEHMTTLHPDGPAIAAREGAGAAGGTAFGLACFAGAKLRRGIDLILDTIRFRERCVDADLVITGEGSLDGQSIYGKATMGVARAARASGCRVVGLVGTKGAGWEACLGPDGLDEVIALTDVVSVDEAMTETASVIERVVRGCCG